MIGWQDTVTVVGGLLAFYIFLRAIWPQAKSKLPLVSAEDFNMTMTVDFRKPSDLQWNKLLTAAAQKFQAPFRLKMTGGREPIILPPRYIDEVKNLKDLSFDAAILNAFPAYVPGFSPMTYLGTNPTIVLKTLRSKLTHNLSHFTEDLAIEVKEALPVLFPEGKDWQETLLKDSILDLVTRMSSLVFLGRDFEHREEWHKISSTYSTNMFHAQRVLIKYPEWSRPLVHHFLPSCQVVKEQKREAAALIEPYVKARQEGKQRDKAEGSGEAEQSSNSIDWFEEVRKGKDFDFVASQLLLIVVAVDTTFHTLTNAIMDIATHPDLMNDIRKEIISIINEDGGLTKTTPNKANLLDSAIKQSQRLHPLDQALILRVATKDITLQDGTFIPKNQTIMVGPLPQFDPTIYPPDPYTYNGYRFHKMRLEPGNETKWQLAATQTEHIGFGHGIHACPGRFFATSQMKISLMYLLMRYDWKLREGEERPLDWEFDSTPVNDPGAKLLYKKRTPEVDF